MYLCSPTLSQISLKNPLKKCFFFSKFWSRDYFHEIKIRFLAAIFKTEHFLNVLFADLCLF